MRRVAITVCALAGCFVLAAAGGTATSSPRATGGQPVTRVGRGVPTPTAIAFLGDTLFVAGFGPRQDRSMHGGVYTFRSGNAVRIDGSPDHVLGITAADGTLYVNGGSTILAWSGWDGSRFAHTRVVVTGPRGFTGFNGIIAAPGGRLYAGISLGGGTRNDSSHGTTPLANSVVTIDVATGAITRVSTGYRQPWQFAFLPGVAAPLVSDLGQENLGAHRPPDFIVEARTGTDYGFPACPQRPAACNAAAAPFATFPAHASPMGLGVLGDRLYVALYGGTGAGPDVVSLPLAGGAHSLPLLVGFRAPVVALGVHGGRVFAGDLTGAVYAVTP